MEVRIDYLDTYLLVYAGSDKPLRSPEVEFVCEKCGPSEWLWESSCS